MNGLLLISIIIGLATQSASQKAYQTKTRGGTFVFAFGSTLFALIFFVATLSGQFVVSFEYLPYSVLFATFYVICTAFTVLAIKEGPLSLTSLINSMSLIIPSLYGIIFLNEPTSLTLYLGIALLLISLTLINVHVGEEDKKINARWVLYVLLAFIGNGGCSTVQRMQQINADGQYKTEFMVVALSIVVLLTAIIMLVFEKDKLAVSLKHGVWFFAISGIMNGMVNFFVILLSTRLPASFMFPVISAGGIITTFVLAIMVYKEKLSHLQYIGSLIGLLSIVLLNL